MVQNVIHRSHVLPFFLVAGKNKEARSFSQESVLAVVQGCDREAFFPCSGNGNGTSWNNRGSNGNYWSSSLNSATNGRNLNFNSGGVNPQNNNNRFNGFAVRAVQHTLLGILFFLFLLYDTDTSAATSRPLPGLLRCTEAQVDTFIRQEMGIQPKREYGRALRRADIKEIQTSSVEVLYRGLPQKERDICCHVQGQDCTPSLLQLYAPSIRAHIYTGFVFMYKEQRYALWNPANIRVLSEGKPKLAAQMLCDASRHKRLFHAHRPKCIARDCKPYIKKDGYSQDTYTICKDMERCPGFQHALLADTNNSNIGSKEKLRDGRRERKLDRTGSCKVNAESGRWTWASDRKSDKPAFFKRVSQRVRPICKTRTQMQVLWPLCRRCSHSVGRQETSSVPCAEDQAFPVQKTPFGSSYGKTRSVRGTSWIRVPGCIYKTLAHIYVKSHTGTYKEKDRTARLLKTLEGAEKYKQLSWYISTYIIISNSSQTPDDKGNIAYRGVRQWYDKDNRQICIL